MAAILGPETSSETLKRRLARHADGSLPARELKQTDAYLARSADARRLLERQRRVAFTLRGSGPETPAELRHLLAIATLSRVNSYAGARRRSRRRSLRLVTAVTCAMSAALIVTLTVLSGTAGGRLPTIAGTGLLAFRQPTASAPPANPRYPYLLQAQLGGVTFPDYEPSFGARASGQRTDVTQRRTVRTVYYTLRDGAKISYSVLSGPALEAPASTRRLSVAGVHLWIDRERGLQIVALVRNGRTCVLAGAIPRKLLTALAVAPLLSARRA